jgi:hypothetical protein
MGTERIETAGAIVFSSKSEIVESHSMWSQSWTSLSSGPEMRPREKSKNAGLSSRGGVDWLGVRQLRC